ncbi:MAG TPA: hypothetical protein VNF73_12325 [Candidatus Saccharimonadales bacterium]|nr:hypothetical protein [Candidatus Saccharimonadales bacterium]
MSRSEAASSSSPPRFLAEIEDALGPGVEFELDRRTGQRTGRSARRGTVWLGMDRAGLVDSDDGGGRAMPVLVGLPASTFAGCRVEVELDGAFQADERTVLIGHLPGAQLPSDDLVRIVGRFSPDVLRVDAETALNIATEARRRHRRRRAEGRMVGGRSWDPPPGLDIEAARFSTIHSAPELSLSRLPPRFVRGLEGVLDDDERLLFAIRRPAEDRGWRSGLRPPRESFEALLVLTDRQMLWAVDHAPPGRYLMDWGVDLELLALERLRTVTLERRGTHVELAVTTGSTMLRCVLPGELAFDAGICLRLLERFAPDAQTIVPRRRYAMQDVPLDVTAAELFGQAADAAAALVELQRIEPLIAVLFSPARAGQREPQLLAMNAANLLQYRRGQIVEMSLNRIGLIRLVLSPLIGRLEVHGDGHVVTLTYPAPLSHLGTAFVRRLRRAWANSTESEDHAAIRSRPNA